MEKSIRLLISMTPEERAMLQALADSHHQSMAQEIRLMIRQHHEAAVHLGALPPLAPPPELDGQEGLAL